MIKKMTFLILLTLIFSCTNNDDNMDTFDINGEFTHEITDCDNTENPEINCIEFIQFLDNSNISVLIGGTDIVIITSYQITNNTIQLEKTDGLNFDISFLIKDETTLVRVQNDDIWNKAT